MSRLLLDHPPPSLGLGHTSASSADTPTDGASGWLPPPLPPPPPPPPTATTNPTIPATTATLVPWPTALRSAATTASRAHYLVPATQLALGYAVGSLIERLHMQHRVTHYAPVRGVVWLPVVGAVAALVVGALYLVADARVGELGGILLQHRNGRSHSVHPTTIETDNAAEGDEDDMHSNEDSNDAPVPPATSDADSAASAAAWRAPLQFRSKRTLAVRALGALMGIHYAVSKLPALPRLAPTLLLLVLAVHSMVDGTRRGLAVSAGVATVGTAVSAVLAARGYLAFVRPDWADAASGAAIVAWVPVLLLASATCLGTATRVVARFVERRDAAASSECWVADGVASPQHEHAGADDEDDDLTGGSDDSQYLEDEPLGGDDDWAADPMTETLGGSPEIDDGEVVLEQSQVQRKRQPWQGHVSIISPSATAAESAVDLDEPLSPGLAPLDPRFYHRAARRWRASADAGGGGVSDEGVDDDPWSDDDGDGDDGTT
ncbi:hypothetical protein BC828DRAFT_389196 [Blastocladiella britannica]|nr:hypothetical protein BC828DRAFT_389196 [Blastocladiella britannica]